MPLTKRSAAVAFELQTKNTCERIKLPIWERGSNVYLGKLIILYLEIYFGSHCGHDLVYTVHFSLTVSTEAAWELHRECSQFFSSCIFAF